jgi:hypothetical protein
MSRSLIEAAVVLIAVSILWLIIHRKASAQLGYGLFLLVILKLLVPIQFTVPEWLANLSPSHSAGRAVMWVARELPFQARARLPDAAQRRIYDTVRRAQEKSDEGRRPGGECSAH